MSYGWSPYIPVAKRLANAKKEMNKLRKKGKRIQPVEKTGRKITNTFWGNAWCSHLELFSDLDSRLPRGRTYVRNGSVCHLEIKKGQIEAMVSGSEIYNIKIKINPLADNIWQAIKKQCAGKVGSLLELMQGKLSDNVMKVVSDPEKGLFPQSKDIKLECDCPDWATMCKHVAAVLYGIGARLDHSPELLFLLRDVDHKDLVGAEFKIPSGTRKKVQVAGDLSNIFGIDLQKTSSPSKQKTTDESNSKKITQKKIDISRGIHAFHIKKLRKALGMTKTEFSALLGKNVATISNWETKKGILNMQASSREALEKAFKRNNHE